MGFFQDLKEDLSQAVTELLDEESKRGTAGDKTEKIKPEEESVLAKPNPENEYPGENQSHGLSPEPVPVTLEEISLEAVPVTLEEVSLELEPERIPAEETDPDEERMASEALTPELSEVVSSEPEPVIIEGLAPEEETMEEPESEEPVPEEATVEESEPIEPESEEPVREEETMEETEPEELQSEEPVREEETIEEPEPVELESEKPETEAMAMEETGLETLESEESAPEVLTLAEPYIEETDTDSLSEIGKEELLENTEKKKNVAFGYGEEAVAFESALGTGNGDVSAAEALISEEKKEIEKKAEGMMSEENIMEEVADENAIITKGMKIKGDITSAGSMEVIGSVEGDIDILGKLNITGEIRGNSKASEVFADAAKIVGEVKSSGTVKIGSSSVIIGNIIATSAVIAGAVKGDIDVHGPVVLDTTAIVMGNIKSKSVQINNGAVIEGMCSQSYADVNPTNFFEEYK